MKINLEELFQRNENADPNIFRTLLKAIKGEYNNDFDYLSFKQSIKNLAEMELDQATSFKSAYATASTLGVTKDKIVNSAKKYLNALKGEKSSFADALNNQLHTKVDGKKKEAKELKLKIKEYEQKIAQMKKDIAIFQKKIDTVDEAMSQAKAKILATKERFENTYDSLESEITEDINHIKTFL